MTFVNRAKTISQISNWSIDKKVINKPWSIVILSAYVFWENISVHEFLPLESDRPTMLTLFSAVPASPWKHVMQWFPNPLTPDPSSPPPAARFEVILCSSFSSCFFKPVPLIHFMLRHRLSRCQTSLLIRLTCAADNPNTLPAEMLGKAPTVPTTLLCPVFITWTPQERVWI